MSLLGSSPKSRVAAALLAVGLFSILYYYDSLSLDSIHRNFFSRNEPQDIDHKSNTTNLGSDTTMKPLESKNDIYSISQGYLVWSPSCRIPDVDPFHPTIRKFVKKADPIKCSSESPLTYTRGQTLILNSKLNHRRGRLTCCYFQITRVTEDDVKYSDNADNKFQISKNCTPFKGSVTLEMIEFILVKCRVDGKEIYKNMHSFIPNKEAASEKMKNASQRVNTTDNLSVLMLGIDSVSRLNLLRTMPKTVSHLKQNGWLEFQGYNKIGENTFPNLLAVLTGLSMDQAKKSCWPQPTHKVDGCPFLWKDFSEKDYVTGYGEDEPAISTFNYHKTGFVTSPTNYYFRPFMLAAEKYLRIKTRDSLNTCAGFATEAEHLLHYATEFVNTFHNTLHFGLFWTSSFSHNSINTPAAMDERFLRFFHGLVNTGALNATIVLFFSDHGMRFGKIRETFQGWMEDRLPYLFVWVPEWFQQVYPEAFQNLYRNKNKLISPFDVHETLKDILHANFSAATSTQGEDESANVNETNNLSGCTKCRSLFRDIPSNRSCSDAGIGEHWCSCVRYLSSVSENEAIRAAVAFVLGEIEHKLNSSNVSSSKCAVLSLKRIVRVGIETKNKTDVFNNKFALLFETEPGEALFEATVLPVQKHKFKLSGTVSRINFYGQQSSCINDADLKQYCYCKTSQS